MYSSSNLSDDILEQILYRGEGNSSIVVALKNEAKVIRLLKKDGKIMKSSLDHHVTQHPMRSIKFIHHIMRPLADPFLSGTPELVHLKSDFINKLSKRVEANRPAHRLDKTLHLDDQYALVMSDLCSIPVKLTRQLSSDDLSGPTISIEIKPKQGFLPIHRTCMKSPTNKYITNKLRSSCQYGLTQYLKLSRARISELSNYCPINLFSGCPIRMKSALEGLLRNPQNNLRIFKDLTLAYDESIQSVKLPNLLESFFTIQPLNNSEDEVCRQQTNYEERFIELLIQCLLDRRDQEGGAQNSDQVPSNENFFSSNIICSRHCSTINCRRCDIHSPTKKSNPSVVHKLPQSCVLSSVLRAQKLDTIGPYEANRMLNWLLADAKSSKSKFDILEELSRPHKPTGFGSPYQLPLETTHQYYLRKVWEFLVSLTAKDCSIIVTLRRVSKFRQEFITKNVHFGKHLLREHKTGVYYMFSVGIADLDQKMPLKIKRICENLNQIMQYNLDNSKREMLRQNWQPNQKVTAFPN